MIATLPTFRVLALLTAAFLMSAMVISPHIAAANPMPQTCAEVRQQDPTAADGEYTLSIQGHIAHIYCADMAGTPKEYISLVHTGGSYNYGLYYGSHKNHYYQYWWVYGTDAVTNYTKIRIDPATLIVDQNDMRFANFTSVGKNGYDSSDPNFNPVPKSVAYATGGDCAASWSARGKANVDLTGTDFALDDNQTFAWGGYAANGSVSVDPSRQIVNMTGGGWCGGVGPTGPLKLKLLTPAAPTDQTPPVTTAAVPAGWQNHDVTVTLSATDDGSGVAATYWQLDGAPPQQGTSVLVSTDGTHSLTYWSVDNANNAEPPHATEVLVDKTAPTINGSADMPGWTNQPVVVTFTCADATSGVFDCQAPVTLSTEGANQPVTGEAVDNAGNSASTTVSGIDIDLTPPTITVTADRAPNDGGWYNGLVTFTFACTDALSGVAQCPGPVTLSTQGANQTVSGTVQDLAGNSASVTLNGINIDMTPPVIAGAADRTPNGSGWYNAPVAVSFTCTDDLSGVAACSGPVNLAGEGSDQKAVGSAADKAGNSAGTIVSGINVDLTAPTITVTPDRAPNAGGWYNGPVTFTFACTDALSGVAQCPGPVTLSTQGANQTVSGTVQDRAGNSASVTLTGINIDLTAPVVTFNGNAGTYGVDQQVYITCSATDNLSGVAATTCQTVSGPALSFALGNNAFSASATDQAGNTGNATTAFTVAVTYDGLCGLTRQYTSKDGVAQALCAKLDAAKASAAQGDANSKAGQIGAFINQLQAQTGKSLTAEQAATLTRLARML